MSVEDAEPEHTRSYNCPECGSDTWHIQNRVAPAAAYFDPKITHVKCAECGWVDDAKTECHAKGAPDA